MVAEFSHGYAVVVGVGADLPTTVQDANAVADLLRDPTRCAYPAAQVHLLTNEAAHRTRVLEGLDWLAAQAKADSTATALVYFSGHGLETPEAHLMTNGYDLGDLSGTAIAGSLLTEKLRAIQAQKLLVLLDCCHAGGQATAKAPPLPRTPLPPGVVEELRRSSGRVFIASSRKDEFSYIFQGARFSTFTAALLEGLAGYGAFEPDGFARVLDVALYVGRMVPNRTQEQQHPILKVANLEDNFALAYYAGGESQPKKLDWMTDAPRPALLAGPVGLERTGSSQVSSWRRILANRREALLLIEERMSEYISQEDIPLQLIKNYRKTEAQIAEVEQQLGIAIV